MSKEIVQTVSIPSVLRALEVFENELIINLGLLAAEAYDRGNFMEAQKFVNAVEGISKARHRLARKRKIAKARMH
jgi:hypothetical protein